MTTIAVFGGSGKIGRRAVALCGDRGHSVRALVHRNRIAGDHVTSIVGSVVNAEDCCEVVSGADIVVQMATTKEDAETFFLHGMTNAMKRLADLAHPSAPITIYYAFKQSESGGDGTNSTGW